MEKLKDLYLSDLIDRDVYEKDYLSLKAELEAVEPQEKDPELVNTEAIKTALSVYEELDKSGKKEFWNRIIKQIRATDDGDFFVDLI